MAVWAVVPLVPEMVASQVAAAAVPEIVPEMDTEEMVASVEVVAAVVPKPAAVLEEIQVKVALVVASVVEKGVRQRQEAVAVQALVVLSLILKGRSTSLMLALKTTNPKAVQKEEIHLDVVLPQVMEVDMVEPYSTIWVKVSALIVSTQATLQIAMEVTHTIIKEASLIFVGVTRCSIKKPVQ